MCCDNKNTGAVSCMRERLFAMKDKDFALFQASLMPDVPKEKIIGIRTPELRRLAAECRRDGVAQAFIGDVPHRYFEENQLHAFIISGNRNYEECLALVRSFLPYVDNWATCDQLSPPVFAVNTEKLLPQVYEWMRSEHTYTVRFGIRMLMTHYLGDNFSDDFPKSVANVKNGDYYVDMMRAWYFATALAKQYDRVVMYLERGVLDGWTHAKTIRKALESRRISDERKTYLRSLVLN